jgi:hydroxyacylglutathione hydrolase
VPGLLLLFRSWILLAVPLGMWLAATVLVRREEDVLRREFGAAYDEYTRRVGALLPRAWHAYRNLWRPLPTGHVVDNVFAVRVQDVNLFIIARAGEAIAIDAGYGERAVAEELERLPLAAQSVTHVFLTHTDRDHAGGLDAFPGAQVFLSKDEEQMIDGRTPRFAWLYHNPPIERPYRTLEDGEAVGFGSIRVRAIATPGHTRGSMAFLVDDRLLFTGDTLALHDGRAQLFYKLFDMDVASQKQSIRKLARLAGVKLLCTGHTGCTKDVLAALQGWRSGKA